MREDRFHHPPRQVTADTPTDLEQVIFEQAMGLLDKAWDRRGRCD